jgi:hypothetical protein
MWVAMDETTDSMCHFVIKLVAGKLDTEVPSNPHFICSIVLDCTNHFTVA